MSICHQVWDDIYTLGHVLLSLVVKILDDYNNKIYKQVGLEKNVNITYARKYSIWKKIFKSLYKSIFTNSTLNPIFVDRKFPMPKDESYSVFWIDFFEPFKKVE